jgi:hypothetical protein
LHLSSFLQTFCEIYDRKHNLLILAECRPAANQN